VSSGAATAWPARRLFRAVNIIIVVISNAKIANATIYPFQI